MNGIDTLYPEYRSQIGEILGAYQIAPSNLSVTNNTYISAITPPRLSWKVNGSINNPNDFFKINFYDYNGNLKYTINSIVPPTKPNYNEYFYYDISQSAWNEILSQFSGVKTIGISVAGYHTSKSPVSGPYFSSYSYIIFDANSNFINIQANDRYTEQVTALNRGDFKDYIVTFASSGNRLLQTFGTKDTYMYLYDSEGYVLKTDDDSGYSTNALISYNFTANIKYRIRVKFYSDTNSGTTKLVIIPSKSYTDYDYISMDPSGWKENYNSTLNLNQVDLYRIKFSVSTEIELFTKSNLDTYLYLIDPRSADPISSDFNNSSVYNDDGGGNGQAKIKKVLEKNIPYLVIVSAYTITTTAGSYTLTVSFSENHVQHTYNKYSQYDKKHHKSSCSCGRYILESHAVATGSGRHTNCILCYQSLDLSIDGPFIGQNF